MKAIYHAHYKSDNGGVNIEHYRLKTVDYYDEQNEDNDLLLKENLVNDFAKWIVSESDKIGNAIAVNINLIHLT